LRHFTGPDRLARSTRDLLNLLGAVANKAPQDESVAQDAALKVTQWVC
jgi:hypothetical protein